MRDKFLTAVCLLMCQIASAENLPTTEIEYRPLNARFSGESATNRAGKKFLILYDVTGLGEQRIGSSGASFGYFLTPNSILSLQVLLSRHAKDSSSQFANESSQTDERWNARGIGLSYKAFLGNSAYLNFGLIQTSGSYETSSSFVDQSDLLQSQSGHLDFSVFWARVAFGNQWQWRNFTLGCDWFGLAYPLGGKTNITSQESVGTSDSSFNMDEKAKYAGTIQPFYLHFYLGAAF